MPPFSRTPIEPSRSRTEARRSGSDRSARIPLRNNFWLPQRAEITENTVARNEGINSDREEREAEPILVYQDWEMRSPSPVELTCATTYFTCSPIHSTFAPTYVLRSYEDTDTVMASPTHDHPTRSPTPEQIQHSASLPLYSPTPTEVVAQDSSAWGTSSSWGVDPPHSPTSEEGQGSRPWGHSPWETDATQDESTEDSSLWGADATQDESTEDSSLWGTDATQDESTEDSSLWGTDATQDESTEDSSLWGTESPRTVHDLICLLSMVGEKSKGKP